MATSGEGAPSRPAVAFAFFKKVEKFRIQEISALGDKSDGRTREEVDFVTGVEGKEVHSTKPKELHKELIIPLIKQNRWEILKRKNLLTEQQAKGKDSNAEFEAIKEVLEDSRRFMEQQEERDGHAKDETFAIPMLLQNKVPDGFEDGEKVDVSLRPDVATEADYMEVPVEAYGLAMIRGMGWKPGEGIGKTFKQDVKAMEHQLRPKGLGLGADRSALVALEGKKPARSLKPGDQRVAEEPLGHVPGGHVLLESGPHKGLCGKIEAVDADNARLVVRLALGGNAMTVSQYVARPMSSKEYEKFRQDSSENFAFALLALSRNRRTGHIVMCYLHIVICKE